MIRIFFAKIKQLIQQKPLLMLFCCWAFMQLLLFFTFGIVTDGETKKYSDEAQNLLSNGYYSEAKYIFYSGYILLHIIFKQSRFETAGVYISQMLVNLLSMFLLFKMALHLSKNTLVAFLCVLLMIVCYSWQLWAVHLYTESLFCPLVIIFTYALFIMEKSSKQLFVSGSLFLLVLFTRPTGLLFIPAMGWVFIDRLIRNKKILAAVAYGLCAVVVFLFAVNYAMQSGTSYDFIKPLVENYVICDIPAEGSDAVHAGLPENIEGNLAGLMEYIANNPLQFLKMAALKFLSYWGMTRPYYSLWHNLAFICFFYPLYVFAFVGIRQLFLINNPFALYGVSVLIIFTLSVMFTCDDWNNRFIMPILPFVILFASFGIGYMIEKITKRRELKSR